MVRSKRSIICLPIPQRITRGRRINSALIRRASPLTPTPTSTKAATPPAITHAALFDYQFLSLVSIRRLRANGRLCRRDLRCRSELNGGWVLHCPKAKGRGEGSSVRARHRLAKGNVFGLEPSLP